MKKIHIILSVLFVAFIMTSCGAKNDWNPSKMGGIEEPDAKIGEVTSFSDGVKYQFSDMEYEEADRFIEEIKNAGFIYSPTINYDSEKMVYSAKDSSGKNSYEVIYNYSTKICVVTYNTNISSGEEITTPTKEEIENSIEWESEKMGGLPAPEGFQFDSIYPTAYQGWTVYYSKASLDELNTYLAVTTKFGYTIDISHINDSDYVTYTDYNDSDSDGWINHELLITFNKTSLSGYISLN